MKKLLLPIFASFMIFAGIGEKHEAHAASQSQVTQIASKYIGVPYVYGGTSTRGFDCSGYTQYVFNQLGVKLKRTAAQQYTQGAKIAKANLQVGDLVFFNTTGKVASHVGIYVGNNKFAHAGTSTGVTIASLGSSYWASKYNGARRVGTFTTAQATAKVKEEVKGASVDFTVYASRGEMALKIAKDLGLKTTNKKSPFVDVKSSSKYAGAVTALYKEGILALGSSKKFNPNAPITRAEMAVIFTRAYDLKSKGNKVYFKDVKSSHYAYNAIQKMASNKISTGVGKNYFGAEQHVKLKELDGFIKRVK